jgi:RNA polymerase sigma factor (sigma-70 family)
MALAVQRAMTQSDSQAHFLFLLNEHRKIVYKVAATYCASTEDRRDLAQEICAQLWRAFPKYDASRRFSTWMYRIALNVAISYLRRTGEDARNTQTLDEAWLDQASAAAPEEPDDRIALLRRFIAGLDDFNRALLLLYLDDHSYREIAEVLGVTETNVGTKLNRLKQRIRDGLTDAVTAERQGEKLGAR